MMPFVASNVAFLLRGPCIAYHGVAERESNQLRIPGDEARVRVGVALGSLAAVFISRLFVCSDYLDWFLMVVASLAATAHNTVIEREKM
ncbi:hypothetical protein D0Y65_029858 [Glycine soja]|uniref:Uncharacterized protein n=1 Tax=Glycine soja TaxID=3848 RepID=A0A445I143_GLYSO|nr:hypothetical protein D0Y65_029858 [Glycine soja]RZB79799.1 hypothetical protein D0Y65_029858 [Glycine soja]